MLPIYPNEKVSPLEVLRRVAALLNSKKRWTKGSYARKADGSMSRVLDAGAARFCIVGAAYRCDPAGGGHGAKTFIAQAIQPETSIAKFNDQTTFPMVKAAIARAIELAEGR